jgi:hypothetical protein
MCLWAYLVEEEEDDESEVQLADRKLVSDLE